MDDVIEAKEGQSKEENYVTLLGLRKAQMEAKKVIDKAKDSISIFGKKAKILNHIARWCMERDN